MIEKENTVSSDLVYTGKTISLRVDTVEVPNKGYQKREIVEHNGVVVIIGITEDNKIILIKQAVILQNTHQMNTLFIFKNAITLILHESVL